MSSYTFLIPHKLDGLNVLINLNRTNKYLAAKHKKEVQDDIARCIALANIPPMVKPVEISFYWVEPNKKRDLDNIFSAKKYILDALVMAKVLENDTQRFVVGLHDEYRVKPEDKQGRVVVTLTEVE